MVSVFKVMIAPFPPVCNSLFTLIGRLSYLPGIVKLLESPGQVGGLP